LLYQGQNVVLLTRNHQIADAINSRGLQTRGELSLGDVPGRAVTTLNAKQRGAFDIVILATQPPQVEEAARQTVDFLAPQGDIVCCQNGLCEERVAPIVGGQHRVIGAVVTWGASMIEPGIYDRTSAGGFVLGRLDGSRDARLERLAMLLEAVGPVSLTENLRGARWSKLAINCAISSLGTIGGDRLGVLLRRRFVRRLALEIMTETVRVAQVQELHLEKVAGTLDLDWLALNEGERHAKLGSSGLFAKHALLLAVGARYRRLRSSMLSAIERGRTPAIDFLNGEVATRGRLYGIPTPVNDAIIEAIGRIAHGQQEPNTAGLERLFSETDAIRGPQSEAKALAVTPSEAPAPMTRTGATASASARESEPD
jgi:2-dehydropantoate 2-reductase